jgi:hypothetical protein
MHSPEEFSKASPISADRIQLSDEMHKEGARTFPKLSRLVSSLGGELLGLELLRTWKWKVLTLFSDHNAWMDAS